MTCRRRPFGPGRLAALAALLLAAPALAADREAAEAALKRAVAAFEDGRPRAADEAMRAAIKADPGWGFARAVQGRIQLALGNGAAAEAELERAVAAGVPEDRLRHLFAEAHLLNGAPDRALAAADRAAIAPDYAAYAARIRGQAQMALGNLPAAEAELNDAAAIEPGNAATWVAIGRFRMAASDQAGAIDAADRAVAAAPGDIGALLLKGQLVRNQYGLVAALPWFERASEIDPQNIEALLETAATLGDLGRMRDMLAATRRVLALAPGNPQAFYLQATLAARAHDYRLARALLSRIGDRLDAVPGAALLAATLAIEEGATEQAILRLDRLLAAQPDNDRARRLLGAAKWRAGDYQGVIAALAPIADRPDADSYTLAIAGRAFEAMGDRVTAARYLDRAARPVPGAAWLLDPGGALDTLARDSLVDANAGARVRLIRGLIADGQGGAALAEAQALQRAHGGTPAAHMLVGDALMVLERPIEAADAYRRAANISFSEPIALRLIEALDTGGQPAAALATLRLFLQQNPINPAALLLAADAFQRAGDWDPAIRVLEGLRLRMGGRDALLLNRLAWAHFNRGDGAAALPYAARAYRLAPSHPAIADGYGWMLVRTGRSPARGIELLEKAAAIAPAASSVQWHLAQAYAEAGRKRDAAAAARAALAQPGFAEAADARAFIARL